MNSIFSQPAIVRGIVTWNRFEHLCGWLHFNGKCLACACGTSGYDKIFKIRPVLDATCDKSLTLYNPRQNLSIDEAMEPWSSSRGDHQSSNTRRSFKVWCRADSTNGYIASL